MKINRPLVVMDLETTGTWIEKDRIIEIGMIRCESDGKQSCYEQRVNPGMYIPAEVTEVTGINNEDVKGCPNFRQIASAVLEFVGDADLAGFNLERFDLPLLAREFKDNGYEFKWETRTIYDAQKVYHLHEKRDLTAAYAFYCHKELLNAHSALGDVRATLDVLVAQVEKYGQGKEDLEALREFDYKKRTEFYDATKKFRWWDGELYMVFGKYAKKESLKRVAEKDRGYLQWILTQDFSDEVKELIEGALDGNFPVFEEPKISGNG